MIKNRDILMVFGMGLLLFAFGALFYIKTDIFNRTSIHTNATIEATNDEIIKTGGMSKFGGEIQANHACTYILRTQIPQTKDVLKELRLVGRTQCISKGTSVPIFYDPENIENISLGFEPTSTSLEKFLTASGVLMIGAAYFLWTKKC